tara:strand:+ start:250 stop:495 length:246 start_codon:yes stop_codon:yes gene_type:complete
MPLLASLFLAKAYFASVFVALLYAALLTYVAIEQSIKKKRLFYLGLTPLVFTSYHVSYGVGSIVGLLVSMKSKRFWRMFKN